jgi:tRNA modification GTPase
MSAHPASTDTIAAQATPAGRGGIGIIRTSGPLSLPIARSMFRSSRAGFSDFKPYTLHHGTLLDAQNRCIDEAMLVFMPGPGSFTGEDVAEYHCHGSPAALRLVLQRILDLGAVPAGPGDFSKRAFLNGKMDLTQAEAVAEIINAPARGAATLAASALEGVTGRRIRALRRGLEALRIKLCTAVDFPEEELECLSPAELISEVNNTAEKITEMLAAAHSARPFREGALVVLAGRVNAGKSSLMNALLGRERAIVTDIPGTTRDYLEEFLDLDGLALRIADTAGIRNADDHVEQMGVARSLALAEEADLVLLVLDRHEPLADEDLELLEKLGAERVLVVLNKSDVEQKAADAGPLLSALHSRGLSLVEISAKTGEGLDQLLSTMQEQLLGGAAPPEGDSVAPNERQCRLLRHALEELKGLCADAERGVPYDLLGVRLETACVLLGEITGEIASEDVLNAIFDSFCIGK